SAAQHHRSTHPRPTTGAPPMTAPAGGMAPAWARRRGWAPPGNQQPWALPPKEGAPMTLLNLTPDELLSTPRAVRKRLDLSRPVEREVIEECVELAFQAPTGSNRQGWHFVFVTDPAKKKGLADLYGQSFDRYINMPPPEYAEGDSRSER